ncbi:MAG: hypothetical protein ACOX6N_04080 [Patescibacteria group bacterium]
MALVIILVIGSLARAALLPSISPLNLFLYLTTTSLLFFTFDHQRRSLYSTITVSLLFTLSPLSLSLSLSTPFSISLLLATIGFFLISLTLNKIHLKNKYLFLLLIPLFFLQFFSPNLSHLDPEYLFFSANWHHFNFLAPYSGYLLLPSLVFLPLGLIYVLKHPAKIDLLLLLILFIVPAINSLLPFIVIPLSHFISLGIIHSSGFFKHPNVKYFYYSVVVLLYLVSLAYFSDLLLFHAPQLTPYYLQNSL